MLKQMSLDQLHQRQLDMMVAFDEFCREHDLEYFLAYGTLLGAVRHHGFIPWDDDVDIWMKRDDYNKLVSYEKINDTMKIVTKENSGEYYHPFVYCNITDTQTIMKEHSVKKSTGKGVFLDIFPLDVLPNDYEEAIKYMKKSRNRTIVQDCCLNIQKNNLKGTIKKIISLFFNWEKLYPIIQKEAQKYSNTDSNFIGVSVMNENPRKGILNAKDFENSIEIEFENKMLKIPCGFDALLTRCYGDYMTPPDISAQKGHHMVDYYIKDISDK